jgi:excisionase family DNA binding protein
MHATKLLYSRKEAAQLLSISLRSIDHLISSQKIQTRKIGKRVLVTSDSLQEYAGIRTASQELQ